MVGPRRVSLRYSSRLESAVRLERQSQQALAVRGKEKGETMRRYAALVVSVTVALVLFPSPYECTAGDHPDKLQILSLLEKRDFAALDRLLATLQENSEKDISKEVDVQLAFEAFATSRPELEPLLNEWITKRPKSYPAQLAAGEYFNHLGWQKRGYK